MQQPGAQLSSSPGHPYLSRVRYSFLVYLLWFLFQRRQLRSYAAAHLGSMGLSADKLFTPNFLPSLRRIASIALPTWRSREGFSTATFIALFFLKAYLVVQRSVMDGAVLEAFLAGTHRLVAVLNYVGFSLLGAVVNGAIQHVRYTLIAAYRLRLTTHFHARYLNHSIFYYGTVLDDRIRSPDVVLTKYCHEFAEHFAELPYYFLMPLLEATSSLYIVGRELGVGTAAAITAMVLVSLRTLRVLTPPFGKIHSGLLHAEETFRRHHTELAVNTEQIALQHGGGFLRRRLDQACGKVCGMMRHMALARGYFVGVEMAMITLWNTVGFLACGLTWGGEGKITQQDSANALRTFVVHRHLIRNFHSAVKKLALNLKEISHLTEFTNKLAEFDTVLSSLARGEFHKHVTTPVQQESEETGGDLPYNWSQSLPDLTSPSEITEPKIGQSTFETDMEPDELICAYDIDVVTPARNILVHDLTLHIRRGENWVITGPNGAGKSSLVRMLAGLWFPAKGAIRVHPLVDFFVLPQQALMVAGCTLLDQVIFPDYIVPQGEEHSSTEPCAVVHPPGAFELASPSLSPSASDPTTYSPASSPIVLREDTMESRGARGVRLDEDLVSRVKQALEISTGMSIVPEVFGNWTHPSAGLAASPDLNFEWSSLSGGQQQKVALARMFYHGRRSVDHGRIPVVVMDESTSQMDFDAEEKLFKNLATSNIQLISLTHRPEVMKYHERVLILDRESHGWKVRHMSADNRSISPARAK